MSNNAQKVAAVVAGIGILNGVLESPTVQQAIPTNEPSSSQVQTTEAKCDPLADKSKEPSDEEKYGIPSEEMQQLGDSHDKSNDEKREQAEKDANALNQPTISGSPPELTSCLVPSEDKYAQLQEPITASGVTDPELRVNTPIPEQTFPKPDIASLSQKPETHSYNIDLASQPATNSNAELANQLRGETSSPYGQSEPQEANSDSGNIA
jgi:hypothetical protein